MFLKFKEPNKRGGWNFSQKIINGEALIRVSRVEKFPKINKRACPFIRKLRVTGFEPAKLVDTHLRHRFNRLIHKDFHL